MEWISKGQNLLMIKKSGSKYNLYSKSGKKKLGSFKTKAGAMKRERQINYYKKKKGK